MKARRPTELECQATIVAAAKRGQWRIHAERTSRTNSGGYSTAVQGHKGWPDLVLAHEHRGVAIIELKRKPNKVEPDQQAWLDLLAGHGIDARVVWVPEQMDDFCRWLIGGVL